MVLPKTYRLIGMAAALFSTTAIAALPQKPLDESRIIAEPVCLNKDKKNSGLDVHGACQGAIDALERQTDGIVGHKNNCKEVSKNGNCVVAICGATNENAKLDPKLIAEVAQGIHAYCKVGPKDNRWTGGSSFTYGLQPWGQERLGVTVYLGQMYAAPVPVPNPGQCGPPTCKNRRAVMASDALERLSPRIAPLARSRVPMAGSLLPRAPGDTKDVGGGWRLKVKPVGQWQVSSASRGHMNVLGARFVQRWDEVRAGQGGNAVTATITPTDQFGMTMQLRAADGFSVEEVNPLWRQDVRRVFADLWEAEERPGVFTVAIERVTTLTDEPFVRIEEVGSLMFIESRINRDPDANQVPEGIKIVLGSEGIRYGSFGPIS